MLHKLSIRNAALIEHAELSFSGGLNVLSGETGAGKSVILDCIDFVLGAKADRSMIRFGAEECLVRAEFSANESVNEILSELDIETDETLILSRKISADGRGAMKINGNSVTASMLRRVTSLLVDVHGQSEHFFLLKESNQLQLLDAVGGLEITQQKEKIAELLAERKEIIRNLKLLGGDENERTRKLDILRYQIDEINRAQLKENEEEDLLALRNLYLNAEKILNALSAAKEYLLSESGSIDSLNGARRALSPIVKIEETYSLLAERMENAAAELTDIADAAETLADQLDIDEREAERVENRLDEIKTLKKKYGASISEILTFYTDAQSEYDLLSDSGEKYDALTEKLKNIEDKLYSSCKELTERRKITANTFTERVIEELKALNITAAKFEIVFEEYSRSDVPSANGDGLDKIKFLFSANAGEPLKELSKIISGGETSRFMLAIKSQLSAVNQIQTFVFDEIDAGIGGRTARVVAEKFCNIARNVQIIAVSHLAQIAAFADREFLIEKQDINGRAQTLITEVTGDARTAEIARLISGNGGEFALKHAEELLQNAKTYKISLS